MAKPSNRVACVTGGAGGIGAACAVRLAEDDFDIVVADVKAADETIDQVKAAGRQGEFVYCDVTDPASVESLCAQVARTFARCDVLVNNAGAYAMVPLEKLSFENWRRFMSLNLDGAFLMSRAFVRLMRENQYGRIVSIASSSFYSNVPGMTAYVASKGGLIGLTRGIASEYGAHGITANVVAPGPVVTEQIKTMISRDIATGEAAVDEFFSQITGTQAIKRRGMPGDVAAVVSFLATDESAFITGQTIVVDGGCVRL